MEKESIYIKNIPENFWFLRFLDEFMEGHKGFIAGGCFKNILSKEKVKDIDIFFESSYDFQEAVDYFNDLVEKGEWKFKYRNEKACAFQKVGASMWVELIESVFGTPEQILDKFDFTVTKFAYYKEKVFDNADVDDVSDTDDKFSVLDEFFRLETEGWHWEYKLLYHKDSLNTCTKKDWL